MSDEPVDAAEAASTADAPTAEAPARGSRWRHRPFIEIVAVAMLSVTALLTAGCGVQASKAILKWGVNRASIWSARIRSPCAVAVSHSA